MIMHVWSEQTLADKKQRVIFSKRTKDGHNYCYTRSAPFPISVSNASLLLNVTPSLKRSNSIGYTQYKPQGLQTSQDRCRPVDAPALKGLLHNKTSKKDKQWTNYTIDHLPSNATVKPVSQPKVSVRGFTPLCEEPYIRGTNYSVDTVRGFSPLTSCFLFSIEVL